uniref:NADH-ubiquinone oxidoreductase chain 2 n=1 Tax=Neocyema erythrosoma TaxID=2024705 RepID=A0A347ZJT7_9TELE|nr:NADH dehydrogenase subunit 2 [Neocyema erythrosoma]BBA85502.1 NADH dehydrogenase subunit 2 [Neocyema erythrosoma]
MTPYVSFVLFTSLGLGTTITFASSHWLLAWLGLEINTLAIIPLMAQRNHPRALEATTKYFLVQAMAATLMLFTVTSNAWMTGHWEVQESSQPILAMITFLALGLKIGIAPMHYWLPEVMQGVDLMTGMILATWQKLAPMAMMFQLAPEMNMPLLLTLAITSTLMGGWGGINQTQLRKILAYSSIANMGWMLVVLKYMPNLMVLSLVFYIVMTMSIFMMVKMAAVTKINMLSTAWAKSPTLSVMTLVVILSIASLPPLTGFTPKWFILKSLTQQELTIIPTLMALSTLMSLFFYLRLCYSVALTTSPNTNNTKTSWRLKSKQMMKPMAPFITLTVMAFPLSPLATALTMINGDPTL